MVSHGTMECHDYQSNHWNRALIRTMTSLFPHPDDFLHNWNFLPLRTIVDSMLHSWSMSPIGVHAGRFKSASLTLIALMSTYTIVSLIWGRCWSFHNAVSTLNRPPAVSGATNALRGSTNINSMDGNQSARESAWRRDDDYVAVCLAVKGEQYLLKIIIGEKCHLPSPWKYHPNKFDLLYS